MPLNARNALSPTLLGMLACPSDDHAPLREEAFDGADTLVCTFCGTRFPIDDGIPVLLLDDATPGPNGVGVAADPTGVMPAVADTRPSPKHALPDSPDDADPVELPVGAEGAEEQVAEVADIADIVEVADVLDADDVEPAAADVSAADVPAREPDPSAAEPAPLVASPVSAPTDSRGPQNPPPARSLAAAVRNRVEHRLAEYEATHGPRRRRGSGR